MQTDVSLLETGDKLFIDFHSLNIHRNDSSGLRATSVGIATHIRMAECLRSFLNVNKFYAFINEKFQYKSWFAPDIHPIDLNDFNTFGTV